LLQHDLAAFITQPFSPNLTSFDFCDFQQLVQNATSDSYLPMSKTGSKIMRRRRTCALSYSAAFCIFIGFANICVGQLLYNQIKVLPPGNIPTSSGPDATMGVVPTGQLIEGFDGMLYGTMSQTNEFDPGGGAVFRMNKDGTAYSALYRFTSSPNDGQTPLAGLVQDSSGSFYGTTSIGGTNNVGTVFKLTSSGNGGFTNKTLKSFTGINGDGANPACKLMIGTDGWLYGTTFNGGTNNVGVAFKMQTNGAGFTNLHTFSNVAADSAHPFAGLAQGTNGMLFGVSSNGAASSGGAIFRLTTNGTGYANLHSFTGTSGDGLNPLGSLVCDTNNTLYGVTWLGGASGLGTVFKINGDGTGYSVLTSFTGVGGTASGGQPRGALIIGLDGILYGTTEIGGLAPFGGSGDGVAFRVNRNGTSYTVLWAFNAAEPNFTDGADPQGGLTQGSDGGFYGITAVGGGSAVGTIFSLGSTPPNDNFTNRIALVGSDAIASGFNLNATLEANEPVHANMVMITNLVPTVATNSIWWSWSGLPNGLVTIQDDANTVNAVIEVYTPCAPPPSGLVNWWRGEDNGADSAGSNPGTLLNGLSFANGMVCRAFSFDGIDDILQINAPSIPPPWSAEVWVNRQATTNDSAVLIGDIATALKLEQYPNTKKVGVTVWNVKDYSFNYTAPIGTWVHLVFVGSATNIELFANGASQGTIAVTNFTLPRGTVGYDVAQGNVKQLKGLLDEISLYNRMLTPAEIQMLYAAGSAGKCGGCSVVPALTNLVNIASSAAPHSGLSNRVSFIANSSYTYQVAVSGTVQENMGPNFAGSGPISLSMRTLDLRLLSVTAISNTDNTTRFTNCTVQIGNAGTVPRGPLRLEILAQAGFNSAASSNAGSFLLPDRLLGTFYLTNPAILAPGAVTTTNIFGVCPAPTNYIFAGTTNPIGWGVFAQLEEQVGTNWFAKDKDLVTYSVWPTNNGFQGPGGGVIRINPTGGTGIVRLTNTTILGPLTVNEGTTNAYQGFVRFSDGGTFTFSNTVWTASLFTITTNGLFHSGPINGDTPVTLGCYYVYDNRTNNATTNILVLNLLGPSLTNFTLLPNKQIQFTLNGVPGRSHVIEAASNLLSPIIWTALATNATGPSGTWIFTDPASANQSRRFYRAHEQ
jgi:uncharacterized repeat protein (TIGR03803 family)